MNKHETRYKPIKIEDTHKKYNIHVIRDPLIMPQGAAINEINKMTQSHVKVIAKMFSTHIEWRKTGSSLTHVGRRNVKFAGLGLSQDLHGREESFCEKDAEQQVVYQHST